MEQNDTHFALQQLFHTLMTMEMSSTGPPHEKISMTDYLFS